LVYTDTEHTQKGGNHVAVHPLVRTVSRCCCPMSSPLERNTPPFFRLSLKSPRAEQCPDPVQRSESIARALPVDSSAATAITTDRVRRMDGASTAAEATDQTRKLAFLMLVPRRKSTIPTRCSGRRPPISYWSARLSQQAC
jgi:hypothetical protein